jgi:hypothetical protein
MVMKKLNGMFRFGFVRECGRYQNSKKLSGYFLFFLLSFLLASGWIINGDMRVPPAFSASPSDGGAGVTDAAEKTMKADSSWNFTVSPMAIEADLFIDDDNTTGTESGSKQYPYNTIQEAINAAASSGETTIAVAGGTYAENIQIENKTIQLYGGFAGGSAADYSSGIGGNFDTQDPNTNQTHIQGDGTDSVVTLINPGLGLVDGFRITGGTGKLEGSLEEEWRSYHGGGIHCYGGSPTISNNIIEDNDTRHLESPPEETFGGGIWAEEPWDGELHISIIDNLIRNNFSGRGGGMSISSTSALIRGNTVEGNIGNLDHGGGIYLSSSSATISYNLVQENEIGRDLGYGWGGGIIVYGIGTSATLAYNVVTGNYASGPGTGEFIDEGAVAVLDHEKIYNNDCGSDEGAGVYVDGGEDDHGTPVGSKVTLKHCIVVDHNCTSYPSNGLVVEGLSEVTVTNSIFWGNNADDFFVDDSSTLTVSYSISEETVAGTGNLSTNPLFADSANHDYHLQSSAGRWDTSANSGSGGWVVDANHSPAIDAGDPASDYSNEPSSNGGRCNMGVYGNTSEASKTIDPSGSTTTTTTTAISTTTTTGTCPSESIYGEHSEETERLRYLRDNVLKQTPEGQEIIRLYYEWSPAIVQAMEKDEKFKEEVKEMVEDVLELIGEVE